MSYTPKLISRRVNAPCYGCKSRILGCHAQCEAYKAYKVKIWQDKCIMSKIYGAESAVENYEIKQKIKIIKRRDGRI